MVLVAPDPVIAAQPHAAPVRSSSAQLLDLLRAHSKVPLFDPCVTGGLRAWLEDAAFGVAAACGEGASPLFVGPRRVLGSTEGAPRDALSTERIVSRLVRALFRQLVTVGTAGDPLTDALDALRAESGIDGGAERVVRHVDALCSAPRTALAEMVRVHASHLRDLIPWFAPNCMPRTDDRIAIPLAGGRVVLGGAIDLLVRAGGGHEEPLCAIGLATDGPWEAERRMLHYLALLETLRSGGPPQRVALLESATGRYGVEDVREEHVRAVAAHVAAWLCEQAGGRG
jgi:hypothetical protein